MTTEVKKLHQRLIKVKDAITLPMILEARKNRNWSSYDLLDEGDKLRVQIEELNTLLKTPKYNGFPLKNR